MAEPGPWLIEGVTALRGLRAWHRAHLGLAPPIDRCLFLRLPTDLQRLLPTGRRSMGHGLEGILYGLLHDWPELGPLMEFPVPRFLD